jgi:hypothetical protein
MHFSSTLFHKRKNRKTKIKNKKTEGRAKKTKNKKKEQREAQSEEEAWLKKKKKFCRTAGSVLA